MTRPFDRTVALVAYDFSSVLVGGSTRAVAFARGLGAHGWNVIVCTASPEPEIPPTGLEVLGIRSPERSWGGGIRAEATGGASELGGNPPWLRLLSPVTRHLPIERQMTWIPRFSQTAAARLADRGVDVVCSMAPPYASIVAGGRLARRLGAAHVIDLRDDWIDLAAIQGRSSTYRRLNEWWIGRALRRAAGVTTVTSVIASRLGERGVKADLVPNGYVEQDFAGIPMDAGPVSADGPLRMAHVGWLGAYRSAKPLLEALVRRSGQGSIDPGVRLLQVGLVEASERRQLEEARVAPFVELLPQVAHSRAVEIMGEADVLLALPGHDLPAAVSGKLYEYLRARRPILLLARAGAATELAREVGLRYVVDPDDAQALSAALDDLVDRKKRGTLCTGSDPEAVAGLERSVGVARLAAVFDRVVSR